MVLNKMSFAPANGPSRPRETAFARQNGASRPAECHLPDKTGPRDLAERHLPDKTGPRASREAICSGKRGLALRGKPFTRQNGASRCAGSRLPDKTGPREPRNAICPTKWGLATLRNAKPRLISYISRLGSPDCPPRRDPRRFPSMGRGACRRLAPRRDRGHKVFP